MFVKLVVKHLELKLDKLKKVDVVSRVGRLARGAMLVQPIDR
jgi:hypothetical protein